MLIGGGVLYLIARAFIVGTVPAFVRKTGEEMVREYEMTSRQQQEDIRHAAGEVA